MTPEQVAVWRKDIIANIFSVYALWRPDRLSNADLERIWSLLNNTWITSQEAIRMVDVITERVA